MARFTLVVDLDAFTDDVRAGVRITANPSPPSYPEAGVGIHTGPESEVTDASGVATFDLVSLPDLTYLVTGDGFDSVRISGDQVDGSTVRLDEAMEVAPSVIAPTTAAELRAEIADKADAADVAAAAETATWAGVSDKPTTFAPSDSGIFTHLNNGASFTRITVDAIAAGAASAAISTGLDGGDIETAIDAAVAAVSVDTAAFAFAPLKASLDQGNPRPVAYQVIGDSTGNDDTEWARRTLVGLASRYPSVTFQEARYSAGSEFTQVPTVIQTGTAGAAYLLVETGKTTPAIPQASAPTFPAVLDLRVKLAADDWTTTTGGGVIIGRENGAPNRSWWLSLAGSGYPQLTLSSDGTALSSIHNGGTPVPFADGATGWLRVVYTCDDGSGNRVFKAYTSSDGNTWTQLGTTTTTAGALTPHSPSNAALTLGGRGGGSGLPGKIYEVQMLNGENGPDLAPRLPGSWPMTPTGTPMTIAGAPVCTLVNGSYSGANAALLADSTRLAKMTPNYGQQVIFISDSHNEGGLVDADFIATYSALVNAAKARIPGVPVAVVTQNPENGAVNQVAHSARRWNLVAFAAANGYALIDTYKAFLDYGAWQADLMVGGGDTLHPNAAGSQLWADTVLATFDNA